jgi:phosphopantothenoylcysteine decarboxylase / phosphopantothenate---cysteine ligase
MKILLGITGSIASIKSIDIIMNFIKNNIEVDCVLTKSAEEFVDITELQNFGNKIYQAIDLWDKSAPMLHIDLARNCDAVLIAPASANFIAKLAGGFGDDLLTCICLATDKPIIIAPAMNQQMWKSPFVQANIQKLLANGVKIIGPACGSLACGEFGYGRMVEPSNIIAEIIQYFAAKIFSGKKILITAGATIEKIDPVRFISNFSSGKMGYALAQAALNMGAEVILISGKTSLNGPFNIQKIDVESASEMYEQVFNHINNVDIFISCAAVADYSPCNIESKKIKKTDDNLTIKLQPNCDILKSVGELAQKPFLVGFAAETNNIIDYAMTKMQRKNLDMIVANDVADGKIFGEDNSKVMIINRFDNHIKEVENSKNIIAHEILKQINNYYENQ